MNSTHTGAQSKIFQGRGNFRKLRHFAKHFAKNLRKKSPEGKYFGVFSPRYSYNYILNGDFNPKMDTIWPFFLKSGYFL